jgi:hypothetical protein
MKTHHLLSLYYIFSMTAHILYNPKAVKNILLVLVGIFSDTRSRIYQIAVAQLDRDKENMPL